MAYEFKIGRFTQGEGLETALDNHGSIVAATALQHVGTLKGAFMVGGHGARGGEQWTPWSRRYAIDRAFRGKTHILIDTGAMRHSIYAGQPSPGPRVVVLIGTNIEYAHKHQYGTMMIPQRPFLVTTSVDKENIAGRIARWATVALNGVGGV